MNDLTITARPRTGVFAGRECRTNRRGEGLWAAGVQQAGTCQFSAKSPAELLRKIHRIFDCK